MKKGLLILTFVVILAVAAVAVAVPQIEKGLASHAQTDSTGSLNSTLYIEAVPEDGEVLTVPKVKYTQSADKPRSIVVYAKNTQNADEPNSSFNTPGSAESLKATPTIKTSIAV